MSPWIVVVIVLFLALALGIAIFALRRQAPPVPEPIPLPEEDEDPAARRARLRVLDDRGAELLERRIELDSKRGTLGGDTAVFEAFEALEHRLRAGEISEEEFEREKIHLLGGE